jgi:type IV secretory pathway TrbD component
MMMQRRVNPVFRSLNAPLTIMGAERKLFFFSMMMGAAVFNLLHTFIGGLIMLALLYWLARWATKTDPQLLRFLLNSGKMRSQYDPMKFTPVRVREMRHA